MTKIGKIVLASSSSSSNSVGNVSALTSPSTYMKASKQASLGDENHENSNYDNGSSSFKSSSKGEEKSASKKSKQEMTGVPINSRSGTLSKSSSSFISDSGSSHDESDDKENYHDDGDGVRVLDTTPSKMSAHGRNNGTEVVRNTDEPATKYAANNMSVASSKKAEIIKRLTERYNPLQENDETSFYCDDQETISKMDVIKRAAGRYKMKEDQEELISKSKGSRNLNNMNKSAGSSYEEISIGTVSEDSSLSRFVNDSALPIKSVMRNGQYATQNSANGKSMEELLDDTDIQEMSNTALLYASTFKDKDGVAKSPIGQTYRKQLNLSPNDDENDVLLYPEGRSFRPQVLNHNSLMMQTRAAQSEADLPLKRRKRNKSFKSRLKALFLPTTTTNGKSAGPEVVNGVSVDEFEAGSRLDLRTTKVEEDDDVSWAQNRNQSALKQSVRALTISPSHSRVSWWDSKAEVARRSERLGGDNDNFHCCTLHKQKRKEELFRCQYCQKHVVRAVEKIEEQRPLADIFSEIESPVHHSGPRTPTETAWLCFSYNK
jgi:hypothetical protein